MAELDDEQHARVAEARKQAYRRLDPPTGHHLEREPSRVGFPDGMVQLLYDDDAVIYTFDPSGGKLTVHDRRPLDVGESEDE